MSGRLESLQADPSEFNDVAIGERREGVLRLRCGAEVNDGAGAIPQLEVTGDEIGVKMREDHVSDLEPMFLGKRDVLIHVPPGVHDRRRVRLLVADQI